MKPAAISLPVTATAYRQPPEGLITTKVLAWFSHWITSPKVLVERK